MHERAAALDPHVVRKVAELDEVMMLSGVENNSDDDTASLGRIEPNGSGRLASVSAAVMRSSTELRVGVCGVRGSMTCSPPATAPRPSAFIRRASVLRTASDLAWILSALASGEESAGARGDPDPIDRASR